ncbi:DUF2871 domain-containing protein [Corynebacterium tuberculostearicum]|uniref:DUF2871 domain-containing protein n=1 Tax=Corynebacterium tuberculostearicum TaxID=38304 RepID=UPI00265CB0EF|nr:DUF2871 domain-containing protein [Corynebacterium tuberculostearicum]WKE55774.1 DUF2871 domain-containing protein [Corynebacterium tuberculostearicum]
MKALYWASTFYLALGLGVGVFYREFTRANDFPEGEFTQPSVAHTHLLALGFMMSHIFLVLEKVFGLSRSRGQFNAFFWLYNVGVVVAVSVMIWHGCLTVMGEESTAMISGIAGLGHILITIGLIAFIAALGHAISEAQAQTVAGA